MLTDWLHHLTVRRAWRDPAREVIRIGLARAHPGVSYATVRYRGSHLRRWMAVPRLGLSHVDLWQLQVRVHLTSGQVMDVGVLESGSLATALRVGVARAVKQALWQLRQIKQAA